MGKASRDKGLVVLDLPYPVSVNDMYVNRIYGKGRGRILSGEYKAWKRDADSFYKAQKLRCRAVSGPFTCEIILSSEKRRHNADCDNRIKPILDFLQRVELIENDSLCDRVSIEWGEAKEGCRVYVQPSQEAERNNKLKGAA